MTTEDTYSVNETTQTLDVTFRLIEDSDDEIRTDQIGLDVKKKMMNNEKMNQIIDEVYENYLIEDARILPNMSKEKMLELGFRLTKEEFINKCKTDSEFSERWGLKIEERELFMEEGEDLRLKLILEHLNKKGIITSSFEDFKKDENIIPNIDWRREVWGMIIWINYGNGIITNTLEEIYDDVKNLPTKLITITYNGTKIESYE